MTPIEAEALLVRHAAAIRGLDFVDEDGRWELLGMVVFPSEDVENASMTVAEESGPRELALLLARRTESRQRRQAGKPAQHRVWLKV